jgi:hypothetical protein
MHSAMHMHGDRDVYCIIIETPVQLKNVLKPACFLAVHRCDGPRLCLSQLLELTA